MSKSNFQELSNILNNWVGSTGSVYDNLSVKDALEESPGNIVFRAGVSEMMRITESGFWVRGVRVEQDAKEAATVYRVFRQWLIWGQLNRE
jgi:hypothetical protein